MQVTPGWVLIMVDGDAPPPPAVPQRTNGRPAFPSVAPWPVPGQLKSLRPGRDPRCLRNVWAHRGWEIGYCPSQTRSLSITTTGSCTPRPIRSPIRTCGRAACTNQPLPGRPSAGHASLLTWRSPCKTPPHQNTSQEDALIRSPFPSVRTEAVPSYSPPRK